MVKFFARDLQKSFKNLHFFNIFAFYTSYPKVTSKATMVYKNISKIVQNDPFMVQKWVQNPPLWSLGGDQGHHLAHLGRVSAPRNFKIPPIS